MYSDFMVISFLIHKDLDYNYLYANVETITLS